MKKVQIATGRLERDAQRNEHHAANHHLVLGVLLSAEEPKSAYEILRALRRYGITGPPTVYRALNRLMDSGHVHRLETINAYLACSNNGHNHGVAVFTICRKCRHVDELAEGALARHLRAIATQNGFHVEAATIELTGQCSSCSKDRLAK